MPATEAQDWWIAVALLLAAAGVRAVTINSSLWWDEMGTLVWVVRKGLPAIMTWSANGNNHVLNSVLIWLVRAVGGEGEIQTRLPAYVLGGLTPPAIYLGWRALLPRRTAVFAGMIALLHFTLHVHATEARGYAGAVLCVWIAQAFFARLVRPATVACVLGYVGCCVAGIGFLPVAILVPLAHGLLAGLFVFGNLWRGKVSDAQDIWKSVLFASAWATLLGLAVFGLPMPQTLYYASHGAANDHLLLSVGLVEQILKYSAGVPSTMAGLILLGVCGLGWVAGPSVPGMRAAFLAPAALAVLWLLIPGGRYSPRLFFLVLPAVAMGMALAAEAMMRQQRPLTRLLSLAAVCAWLACMTPNYWRRLMIGNPNLKHLAQCCQSSRVVLLGMQSDMNSTLYFHDAPFLRSWPDTAGQLRSLRNADVVVVGFQIIDRDAHVQEFRELGFRVDETLASWNDKEHVSFLVYRRNAPNDERHRIP